MTKISNVAGPNVVDTEDIRTLPRVSARTPMAHQTGQYVTPISPCTNWVEVNLDASDVIADVSVPGELNVTDHEHLRVLQCGYGGTSVLVRMRYPTTDQSTPTTIRIFGFDGAYFENDGQPISEDLTANVVPKPEQLPDIEGNLEIVLTPDPTNDPQDSDGNAYTLPVRVDFHGNLHLIFPSVGESGQGVIEARVI